MAAQLCPARRRALPMREEEYDRLLAAAAERLGHERARFRGRVAHTAMLDTWVARHRLEGPRAFSAFLEEAVRQEAASSDASRRRFAIVTVRRSTTSTFPRSTMRSWPRRPNGMRPSPITPTPSRKYAP